MNPVTLHAFALVAIILALTTGSHAAGATFGNLVLKCTRDIDLTQVTAGKLADMQAKFQTALTDDCQLTAVSLLCLRKKAHAKPDSSPCVKRLSLLLSFFAPLISCHLLALIPSPPPM